ncbi:YqgE/AlgH family protein [Propionibacteriaceae bacterium Y1685]|uniref:YqgE/AlgH family protein n=1 Tax=Microlunatus sp. Y1700 TaxID=3418487 RepID=UPI003B790AAD
MFARTPSPGDLLLASVSLSDGVFDQTVVLLLDLDETGALGVVLNQLADTELDDVLPEWAPAVTEPRALFAGGPVSPNGAVCLASLTDPTEDPPGFRRLFDRVGLLHLETPIELVRGAYQDMRIFAGYSGWRPDQLESEIAQGMWWVASASYADVFGHDQSDLWRRCLRRQPGELAFFSTWSEDPERN